MTGRNSLRAALLSSCALLFPMAGLAQTAAVTADDAQNLGTIILDTKRDVATDTATAVTTIDQDELNDRQASTIAELISSVPGVTLINGSTPLGGGINIRGFGGGTTYGANQKVLITVDGATKGSEELYRIGTQLMTEPELFKSVSVIRGTAGSFEYGSGVVGGIVQLETKDASDFTGGEIGFKLRQGLQFSSNGDGITSSTVLAWQPSEDLELLAHYIWRTQEDQDDGAGNMLGKEGFTTPSWGLKAKYTFGQNRDQYVSLSYSHTELQEYNVPYDALSGTPMFGTVYDRYVEDQTVALKYNWNPVDNDLVDLTVALTYGDQKIDQIGSNGTADADHRYETTKLTVKNTANFNFAGIDNELRTGVEFMRKERLTASSAPGGTDDRIAFFAINKFDFGNGLTITPAMRYETQDIRYKGAPQVRIPVEQFDNDALMGGIDARYEWANGIAVFGSVSYTESLPILDDFENQNQNWNGTFVNYMKTPEQSRTWEIGASYRGADLFSAGDAFSIKANIYQTDVWNVTSESGSNALDMKGLELEAGYSMENGFYSELSANLVDYDSRFIGNGTATFPYWRGFYAQTPADSARLVVGKRWDEELDLSWEVVAAKRWDDSGVASQVRSGFGVHNLRATYKPQEGVLQGTEIRVGVENLFDKEYNPRLGSSNGPGRNVKLGIFKTF